MIPPRPARGRPRPLVLEGAYVRLEPLNASHVPALYAAVTAPGAKERFRFMSEPVPHSEDEFGAWVSEAAARDDPMMFAVIDAATDRAGGRQALMRMAPKHGVVEIGSIMWGPDIARSRKATEALFLAARHVFDTLGYRRLEWKCNALNEPSRRAAERFGFVYEGTFRQHMIVKGANRDTAWFAMLDRDWLRLRPEYERWLDPANFDAAGRQKTRLHATN